MGGIYLILAGCAVGYVTIGCLVAYFAARFEFSNAALAGYIWPLFLCCLALIYGIVAPVLFIGFCADLGREERERR